MGEAQRLGGDGICSRIINDQLFYVQNNMGIPALYFCYILLLPIRGL